MWFHAIPDGRILLRSKGNFFQRPAFRGPGNRLFASWGSGFIRIGVYRDVAFVKEQIDQLAQQLASMAASFGSYQNRRG